MDVEQPAIFQVENKMRVISGKAKGMRLKRVPGEGTRPIMDRAKESLFNILNDILPGSRWLDLFAGTGQVGIEALSRGAMEVVFVDNGRAAVHTIKDNLRHTRLAENAIVLHMDSFRYLESPIGTPFDLIYVAPPQYKDLWAKCVIKIDGQVSRFLMPDGLLVVQIDPKEHRDLELTHFVEYDSRRYGNTLLCFYELLDNVT
ncbi:MAG: 16S rRNA (guanine(966)-N(2))-methyltransferase RsmD [Candidatus Promineifilaceae bacterium]|nr:16S rRNA (guanine(966)-N(2))-methyltransferase RsmD [Candidatus Promineifilaceae bacterium]